jgi:hypothetical protein
VNRATNGSFYVKGTRIPRKNLMRNAANLVIELELVRRSKWKWNGNIYLYFAKLGCDAVD